MTFAYLWVAAPHPPPAPLTGPAKEEERTQSVSHGTRLAQRRRKRDVLPASHPGAALRAAPPRRPRAHSSRPAGRPAGRAHGGPVRAGGARATAVPLCGGAPRRFQTAGRRGHASRPAAATLHRSRLGAASRLFSSAREPLSSYGREAGGAGAGHAHPEATLRERPPHLAARGDFSAARRGFAPPPSLLPSVPISPPPGT